MTAGIAGPDMPAPVSARAAARIVRAARPRPRFSALAIVGAVGALIVVLVAIFGPLVAPYNPDAVNFNLVLAPPGTPHHLLGTDQLGRDVLSRMLYGARTTLAVGIVSTLLGTAVGLPYGMIAGYFRGPVDMLLMRIADVMLAFPFLLLAVGLAAIYQPTLWTAVLVLGVAQVPVIARIARGATLEIRGLEYVQAALVNGESDLAILRRQILPNVLRPVTVQTTVAIPTSIVGAAILSFLGLGVQPPTADWGGMLAQAQQYLYQSPWLGVFPGVAIFLTAFCFNLLRGRHHRRAQPPGETMNAELVNTGPLLRIEDLRISFRTAHGPVLAVNGVSLSLRDNEVLAIVGESGSGKTVTGLSVLGIEPPGARVTGRIWFRDEELRGASPRRLRDIRGASIAMIFQEPMTALNPSMTVGRQVAEVLRRHRGLSGQEARSRVLELFDLVRMPSPDRYLRSYPHQLSGGMRQRVMIAMAVACDPALLIADEPTSALDPTIQAQILGLLSDLRTTLGMSVLLISHDLGVVSRMADHVIVMYAGHVLEQAPTAELLAAPGPTRTRRGCSARCRNRAAAPIPGG